MRNFIRGIQNIWRWLPVIWRDRDWDNYYIEVILHTKLVYTYNFFLSKHAVTNWDSLDQRKSLQALSICIIILERRKKDFYLNLCVDFDSLKQAEAVQQCEKRDLIVLGKLLGKYLPYWWD